MLKSFIKWPKLVLSAVYEKISEQAKKANTSVKNFVGDDTNIDHISAVVYDVLPLGIKLGLRFEKFNQNFHEHFKTFRNKIYSYEDGLKKENSQEEGIKIQKEVTDDMAKMVRESKVKPVASAKLPSEEITEAPKEEKKKPAKKIAAKKTTKAPTKPKKTKLTKDEGELPTKSKPAAMTAKNKRKTEE